MKITWPIKYLIFNTHARRINETFRIRTCMVRTFALLISNKASPLYSISARYSTGMFWDRVVLQFYWFWFLKYSTVQYAISVKDFNKEECVFFIRSTQHPLAWCSRGGQIRLFLLIWAAAAYFRILFLTNCYYIIHIYSLCNQNLLSQINLH
jgi:hypothetical protein